MEHVITQDNITGTDSDGSRDGRFVINMDPVGCFAGGADYFLQADCRVGHVIIPRVASTCKADLCHWFRFKLPFNINPNLDVLTARLRLHWNPTAQGDANVNNAIRPLTIKIGVFAADDGPIPASAADALTKYNTTTDRITWSGGELTSVDGKFVAETHSASFASEDSDLIVEVNTIRRAGWSLGNHILIFLVPDGNNLDIDRYATFRTWSWLKAEIAAGRLSSDEMSTAPRLVVTFKQNTPGKDLGDEHVEHTLAITQSIGYQLLKEEVEHTLVITHEHTLLHEHVRSIEHTLELTQDINLIDEMSPVVEDQLVIEQDIFYTRQRGTAVESELTITQTIDLNVVLNRTVEHVLDIEQTIVPSGVINRSFEHTLEIEQDIATTGSTIAAPLHVEHTISFEQTIELSGTEYSRGLEHNVSIDHVFTGYLTGTSTAVCKRKDLLYDPSDGFPAEPVLVPTGSLILQFPPTTPTDIVTLPQPLLSNHEDLNKTRIQRKTRAGDLKTYVDTAWPTIEVFRFKFQDLTDAEKIALFNFIALTLAQEVRLTDHEDRSWDGVIANPNGEYTQIFRDCGHTAEFDFQVTTGPI